MKMQLIRNATLKLDYGGIQFLIDPYLGEKHSQPSWVGISPNPTVDLPFTPEAVLAGVDRVLVSHLHPDHFDEAAEQLLPKDMPLLCQPEDLAWFVEKGFIAATALESDWKHGGLTITRTPGQHGHGERLGMMGTVSGYVFQHQNEPTIYWMGDTVWYRDLEKIIDRFQPDIIVTHSCGATWGPGERPVVTDAEQTMAVCRFAPNATVVATHMDAIELVTVSRIYLRQFAIVQGISAQQLLIPQDGETIFFQAQKTSKQTVCWTPIGQHAAFYN